MNWTRVTPETSCDQVDTSYSKSDGNLNILRQNQTKYIEPEPINKDLDPMSTHSLHYLSLP